VPNQPARDNPAMAHLYIINPLSGATMDNLFSSHPATENRIAALQQLATELGTGGAPTVAAQRYPSRGPWGRPSNPRGPWG